MPPPIIFWATARLYPGAGRFLQRPSAEAVVRAQHELEASGYGLIIHDGYRPWYITRIFWGRHAREPEDLRPPIREKDPSTIGDAL